MFLVWWTKFNFQKNTFGCLIIVYSLRYADTGIFMGKLFCGNRIRYGSGGPSSNCDNECANDAGSYCGDGIGQYYNIFSYE